MIEGTANEMNVFMYICMYVCMYACMDVCMCACTYVYIVYMYVCKSVFS